MRLRAELRAERGEHRVARVREGVGERAAAGLVARVAQPDARQRRRRAHRIGAPERRDLRLQRRGRGDDLERRAGRLGGGDGEAAEREHGAVARAHHRDPAEPVAERGDRRALEPGPDRRAHRAPAPRLRGGDAARAEAQLGARAAAEAVVVARLEPEARVVLGGRAAGDRLRGRLAVEAAAVGGEHGGAPRARADRPLHALAGAQAGEPQVRPPAHPDAVAGARHRQRDAPAQRAEQLRAHRDRDRDLAVDRLARAADDDLLDRRLRVGHAVVGREALRRVLRARVGVELGVHRRRPAPLPRRREAHRGVAQLGAVVRALAQHVRDGARGGEQQHEDDDREQRQPAAPPAAGLDPAHAPAARAARGREHRTLAASARHRGYSAESRNAKNIALQRSAASIGGKWPEPSNISISTRPPASR